MICKHRYKAKEKEVNDEQKEKKLITNEICTANWKLNSEKLNSNVETGSIEVTFIRCENDSDSEATFIFFFIRRHHMPCSEKMFH